MYPDCDGQRAMSDHASCGQDEQCVPTEELSAVRHQSDTQVNLLDRNLVMACNALGCFPFAPSRRLPIVEEHTGKVCS